MILALLACISTEPPVDPIPQARYSGSGGIGAEGRYLHVVGGSGHSGKADRNNAWRYDTVDGGWTEMTAPPEHVFRASWAQVDGTAYLHAGSIGDDNTETDQLLAWDLEADRWSATAQGTPKPSPRYKEAATWTGERLLGYGGQYNDVGDRVTFGELWSFDPGLQAWEELTQVNSPGELTRIALAWDEARGVVWMVGGIDPEGVRHGWLWSLDVATWEWTQVTGDEDGPGPRASHTLALVDGKLFVWGGWREDADVWVYDPDADAWTEIPNTDGPLGRDAQVTGVADDGFYIFGGDPYDEDVPDFTNDLWHFDAVTEAWTELQPWTDSDLGQ